MQSIVILSPCGRGNLGDAAIQDALIWNIKSRLPGAVIRAITLNPHDTATRHGITAFPILADPRAQEPERSVIPGEANGSEINQDIEARSHWSTPGSRLVQWTAHLARRILPRGWPWRIKSALARCHAEPSHWIRGYRYLHNVDVLIFSGGGQLDDYWGGPWQHPFALVKWSLLARLRGARTVFLSVGYGSLDRGASRLMVRCALGLADYRSYRDSGSRDLMRKAGFKRDDPIYPDLAYSLPQQTVDAPAPQHPRQRVVGLCPFPYFKPKLWARTDSNLYSTYLRHLISIVQWLNARGYRVSVFASHTVDCLVIDDLMKLLRSEFCQPDLDRVEAHSATSVRHFLEHASSVSCLIASRLHSVLLSHLVGTPVIALSYERKVDVQMENAGQKRFRLPIEGFRMEDFEGCFTRLEAERESASQELLDHRTRSRDELNAQFDMLFCESRVDPLASGLQQGDLAASRPGKDRDPAPRNGQWTIPHPWSAWAGRRGRGEKSSW